MDNKVEKQIAIEIACKCISGKEINSKVSELIESGIEKEKAVEIVKLAKELRKERINTIKTFANGLRYDSVKTLGVIWKAEYLGKDWKEITKKSANLSKIDSLESFLLAYYGKITESGKLIIDCKDKESGNITHKERNLYKVNAQAIWNNCIDNVLRETTDKKKIQTIYKDSDIVTLEMQAELKAQKKASKK